MQIEYSATKRNESLDEFITPPKLIEAVVTRVLGTLIEKDMPFTVLEPGANLGQWGSGIKAVYDTATLTGVEIMNVGQPGAYTTWHIGDFLEWTPDKRFDVVISNPPYSKPKKNMAELIIRRSLGFLKPGGYGIFLLRTNFGNAKGRSRGLFKEFPLFKLYFLDRPSFYEHDPRTEQFGKKRTNMHDYCLYIWQKGYAGPTTAEWMTWHDD